MGTSSIERGLTRGGVAPGTTVLAAAVSRGREIPHYCWHPGLSISGNCRMCLVEMSNAPGGKLMPACQMPGAEGITVKTDIRENTTKRGHPTEVYGWMSFGATRQDEKKVVQIDFANNV